MNRAPPMAVTVGCHHLPSGGGGSGRGFKPSGLIRRCHFCSFPHPELLSLPPTSLFQRSRSTPCLPSSASSDDDDVASVMIVGGRNAPGIHALVTEAAATLAFGARPVPAATGLGGAYFLDDQAGDCLAVVKPVVIDDNEQLALPSSSIRAGETGAREAAAYLLDHGAFAGVPPTALIRISHHAFPPARSVASIQRFVPHDSDAGDVGPSRFSVSSVHRIAILDIRLLNTDRHAGNLLVKKQRSDKNRRFEGDLTTELVPIDHGLCLPELLDDPYFEWLHWPQAAVPFSDQVIEYVSKLDPFKDAQLLRRELPSIREPAIRILILCTIFLKKAVDYGLCLSEIGSMMTRESCRLEAGESVLETLCKKTEEAIEAESQLSENDEAEFGEGDERKECQFAMDCGDEDKLRIPFLLSKKSLDPLQEEEDKGKEMMTKSLSFSAGELNCDGERVQRSKMISFKNKSEKEWMLFLERFEQLLPEAFEARQRMEMKLRLGSSC